MNRGFSDEVERVAARWRQHAMNEADWVVADDAPQGEADPVYVRSPSLEMGGVAKPRNPAPPVAQFPRAAFEKICADLAFDLELPVPPVSLWRAQGAAGLPVAQMSVSLFPCPPPHLAWRDLDVAPTLRSEVAPHLRRFAARLAVFDSWVGNRDRRNDGNLILWGANANRAAGVAYIDFAQSLLVGWRREEPATIEIVRAFPDPDLERVDEMVVMFERIERLETVEEIVGRVPDDFLSAEQRLRVARHLNERRSTLRRSFVSFLSELSWER